MTSFRLIRAMTARRVPLVPEQDVAVVKMRIAIER